MPDGTIWRTSRHSRRSVLKYGAGGVALLAGCLGGNENGGGGDSNRFRVFDPETSKTIPSKRHVNPWNEGQRGTWHPGALIFDRPVIHSPSADELFGLIATDWGMPDDTTLELTFSEDWTWHDGDQVVADDWVTQLKISLRILEYQAEDDERPHQFIASAEAPDEQTVRIGLHDPVTDKVAVENAVSDLIGDVSRGIFTKHSDDQWSGWLEQLESGNDTESVLEEITTTGEPLLQDAVGNGPFEVENIGDTEMVFSVYEDHPNADNINFDEYVINLYEQTKPTQPYINNKVDAAHTMFPVADDVKGQLPEEHTLIKENFSTNKLFTFNCGEGVSYDTPFTDRNVRKAVCHVFDRQQVTELLQGINEIFDHPPCRIPGPVLENNTHKSAEWVSDFTKYGQNNTERATELLEGAGYSRDGDGNWLRPNGERFEVNVMNGADRKDIGVLKQNLNDFGIATSQEQVDDATFDERRQAGEYDIMPDGSSANGIRAMWALDLVPVWIKSIAHFPMNAEIPMPVGDPEGANGTKEINIEEHIRQWQITNEDTYHKELMWWWNQHVPQIEAMYQPDAGAYNAANWNLDAPDPVINGTEDALYLIPKMGDATIEKKG